ncbi:hypothetical protein [Solibacillus sp. CAU 1738]|uniref:hypothetical protein n=1 Tax=Solibacillus sp. CAU 1738 TaxID=3140363 RepID=UPI003260EB35
MKKFFTSLLAVVVLIVGIYFIDGLFNLKPPKPTITIESNKVEVAQGSYCWSGVITAKCVDIIAPPEIIEHQELKPVLVSPEAKIKIEFNREPKELGVNKWSSHDEIEDVPLNEDDVFLVPKEKGVYIYSVYGQWKKGSSSYVFVIEVK